MDLWGQDFGVGISALRCREIYPAESKSDTAATKRASQKSDTPSSWGDADCGRGRKNNKEGADERNLPRASRTTRFRYQSYSAAVGRRPYTGRLGGKIRDIAVEHQCAGEQHLGAKALNYLCLSQSFRC